MNTVTVVPGSCHEVCKLHGGGEIQAKAPDIFFPVKREDRLLSFSLTDGRCVGKLLAGCVGCVGNDLLGGFLWRDGSPADGTRPGCLFAFTFFFLMMRM